MNKFIATTLVLGMTMVNAFAADIVFDSMEKATEVKLAPAIQSSSTTSNTQTVKNINSVYSTSIKEQKFNSALVNLDDAQVELRQELANTTAKIQRSS